MDWELIQLKYNEASPEVKKLFDSVELVDCLNAVAKKYSFLEQERKSLVSMYGSKVLGVTEDKDLIDFLLSIREVIDVQNIISEIEDCSGVSNKVSAEIAEVEQEIEKLNPIRTMGSDSRQVGYSSNEETTYTSTQSALMNESR